jgi:hypothetical protein
MPDYAPSRSEAFSNIGAGLLDTYFGRLAKERESADEEKKNEQQLRLQAFHALLTSGNTKVADVPNIMALWAKEAKIHNDPGIQEAIDHMKQAATEQVPYGQEQETAQSRIARMQSGVSAASEQNRPPTPVATSINLRPTVSTVPSEPQVPTSYSPYTPQTEGLTPPAPMATPALRVVPPEPQMYQPTRAAGELSQDEYKDYRQGLAYDARQQSVEKRQLVLRAKMDADAAERADKAAAERRALEEFKQKGRVDLSLKNWEQKKSLLEPAAQAKAEGGRLAYKHSLILKGMNEDAAEIASADYFKTVADTSLAEKQAQINERLARMKHWDNMDAARLMSKNGAAGGLSAGQMREFKANILMLLPEWNQIQKQIANIQTGAGGAYTTEEKALLEQLTARRDELKLQIDNARQEVLKKSASTQSAPSTPGTQQPVRRGVPLGVRDSQGLWSNP